MWRRARFFSSLLLALSACESERDHDTDRGTAQTIDASAAADAGREAPRARDAAQASAADGGASAPISEVERGRLPCLPATAHACRPGATWEWSVLVEASQFGPDARLLTVGGDAVLAEAGDGTQRIASMAPAEGGELPPALTISVLPAGMRGVDVATYTSPRFQGLYAILCETSRCGLWWQRRSPAGAQLEEVRDGKIPDGVVARGLVVDAVADALCVYGDGLHCFDGTWREVLPVATKIRKVLATESSPLMMAWTDDGRIAFRSPETGTWQEMAAPMLGAARGTAMLSWSTESAPTAIVFGEGGWAASESGGVPRICELDADVRGLFPISDFRFAQLVLETGQVWAFAREGAASTQWCRAQQLALDEVLATSMSPCGLADNPRVLTRTKLVGSHVCPIE